MTSPTASLEAASGEMSWSAEKRLLSSATLLIVAAPASLFDLLRIGSTAPKTAAASSAGDRSSMDVSLEARTYDATIWKRRAAHAGVATVLASPRVAMPRRAAVAVDSLKTPAEYCMCERGEARSEGGGWSLR